MHDAEDVMIILYMTVMLALSVTSFCFVLRRLLHTLQLSSYQFQGYFRSVRQKYTRQYALLTLLFFMVAFSAFCEAFMRIHRFAVHGAFSLRFAENAFFVLRILIPLTLLSILVSFRPKQEKKPFVRTKRIRRLMLTIALLLLLLCVLQALIVYALTDADTKVTYRQLFSSFSPAEKAGGVLLIIRIFLNTGLSLSVVLVALAGLINLPIERAIGNGFIRDAQRILTEQPALRIIGVTGSFGKTSVKYDLTTLLSEQYSVLMTPESYNTPMGIVRTIREQMKPTHEIFVCEMGARHLHDIKEITDFVHPDDGVLTAIGEQHLETFHSLDNIIATKYELLDAVEEKAGQSTEKNGLKFVNGDDENIRANMKYPDAITYGLKEGNDFRAINITVTPQGTSFQVQLSERMALRLRSLHGWEIRQTLHQNADGNDSASDLAFRTALVGAHNVQNITGAIAVASMYGVPAAKLKRAVRRIEPVPHRLELKRHGNVTILDDAYNANPTGAKTALETLALFRDQVKILVTPGMVELGEKEDAYNRSFGTQAAKVCDIIILVGSRQTKAIAEGVLEAGFAKENLHIRESFAEAGALMYELEAGKEKVILLENDLPDQY